MMKYLVFLFLAGCSADAFYFIPPSGDAASDAVVGNDAIVAGDAGQDVVGQDAKPVDSEAGCQTESRQSTCANVVSAYCMRVSTCCSGNTCGCSQNPQDWFCSVQNCQTHFAVQGYDCQAVSGSVCVGSSSGCSGGIQAATCNDLLNANCTKPGLASCSGFWGLF